MKMRERTYSQRTSCENRSQKIFSLIYTGGTQRAVRHQCAQRGDNENEHSVVTAMVLIVMLQRLDNSDSDSAEIMMCTLV